MLVGATVTGLLTLDAESELRDSCDLGICAEEEWEHTKSRGETLAIATDVLLIAGGVTVAVGAILLLTSGDSEQAPPVTAGCGATGCSAYLRVTH